MHIQCFLQQEAKGPGAQLTVEQTLTTRLLENNALPVKGSSMSRD
jgi:hypothetical protein